MLTVNEVKELAKKTPEEVYLIVRSMDLKDAVKYIREFQEAQANYSRNVGRYDGVAIRLQEIYLMIYKKVMRAYILYMTKKTIQERPSISKEKAKMAARTSFAQFMAGVNY